MLSCLSQSVRLKGSVSSTLPPSPECILVSPCSGKPLVAPTLARARGATFAACCTSQSTSISCRLTLPSSGQSTAGGSCSLRPVLWRRCLPLMSNVRCHAGKPIALPLPQGTVALVRSPSSRVASLLRPLLRAPPASQLKLPPRAAQRYSQAVQRQLKLHVAVAAMSHPIGAPQRSVSSSLPPSPGRIQCLAVQRQAVRCCSGPYTRCYIGTMLYLSVQRRFVPPNPSIEGTSYGLRPPAAPHVKR